MPSSRLIFGLVKRRGGECPRKLEKKLRDLTLAWSRYQCRDRMLEGKTVGEVVAAAAKEGYRYCFLQSMGHVISESWNLAEHGGEGFPAAMERWAEDHEFCVAGGIAGDEQKGFALDPRHVLVDVDRWQSLGLVEAEDEAPAPPSAAWARIELLDGSQPVRRKSWGAGWIERSLRAGLAVRDAARGVAAKTLDLYPEDARQAETFASYLRRGIRRFRSDLGKFELNSDQRAFLTLMATQDARARRGVFLFNIESYDDIEGGLGDDPPLDVLASVAAGFKPNWILERRGFDASTKVVFFDYSRRALDIRERMIAGWDGRDWPGLCRKLFIEFPSDSTHYFLWDGLTPESITDEDLEIAWRRELERWGGADAFAAHWDRYRRLPHRFIVCDVLRDPAPLWEPLAGKARGVVWWSNAFFTMFANWHRMTKDRQRRYERFVRGLAGTNPALVAFGSDHNNSSVNGMTIGDYWREYRKCRPDALRPCRLHRVEIRM